MSIRDFIISHEDCRIEFAGRILQRNGFGWWFVTDDGCYLYEGESEDKAVDSLMHGTKHE